MIQINEVRIPVRAGEEHLKKKVCHMLGVREDDLLSFRVVRRSVDARRKPDLFFSYTIRVALEDEKHFMKRNRHKNIMSIKNISYRFPSGDAPGGISSPVVVGSGPAGLFCAYILSLHGYRPLLLERGREVEERKKDVDAFWRGGPLNPESNVQFGEGGAGTFSDGKLNTGVHDRDGRGTFVLNTFVQMGAPSDILYDAKPHLGTDLLTGIVRSMRQDIQKNGGTVRFGTRVDDIILQNGRVAGVVTSEGETIRSDAVVLAIGHSARDTFEMLNARKIPMEKKPFAVGVRVEHPQEMINLAQYGTSDVRLTGPAPYRLTYRCSDRRGVYSFCMCPGGYVVNASSEPGHLAVNGMSLRARDGVNANSAIVVTVGPDDFLPYGKMPGGTVLSGMYFQRDLERKAFALCNGAVPVQRYEDFRIGRAGGTGSVTPQIMGKFETADVRSIFPGPIGEDICEGMEQFGRKIPGFNGGDAVFSGVESRTSSPVRILRGADGQSAVRGLFPCGEGAGYAGGITSAAIDGIRTAEKIAEYYDGENAKFSKTVF